MGRLKSSKVIVKIRISWPDTMTITWIAPLRAENFIVLEEGTDSKVHISQKDLRINIIRPCERSLSESKYPCMPSLKLDLRDRDYSEPSRDRNKDWKLTSKREIINSVGKEEVDGKQKSSVGLGHYPADIDPLSSLFWSPGFQSQIRWGMYLKKEVFF